MFAMTRQLPVLLAIASCLVATCASADVVLSDDFDPGITAGNFSVISNGTAVGNALPGFLSGNALHFDGNGIRAVTTVGLDVASGGTITFHFRGGNENVDGSGFWEDSDGSGEWADIAYSINNGMTFINFFVLNTELFESQNPTVWSLLNVAIPAAAQTSSTQFRWQQRGHSGNGFDNWAIDNLAIANLNAATVPEPASLAIWAVGALGLAYSAHRRRSCKADKVETIK